MKSKNPLIFLTSMLWRYSRGNRSRVVLYVGMFVVANSIWALEPLVVGQLLNAIQTGGHLQNITYIFMLLGGLLLIDFGGWIFHGIARLIEMHNAFRVKAAYKAHLLEGTLHLPLDWHTDHHSGDTIDKIDKGAQAMYSYSENTFQIIQGVITLTTGVGIMLLYNVWATVMVLVLTIPTFFVLALFDARLVPGYKKVSLIENEAQAKVFDIISNVSTVIILRIEALVHKSLVTAINKSFAQFSINAWNNELKWFWASILGRIASIAVIGLYVWQEAATGAIMVGTIYILYGYVDRIRNVLYQFAYLYNDIVRYRAQVSNTEELSKVFTDSRRAGDMRLPDDWKELEISNLTFSYDDKGVTHLDDVTLTLRHGERVAVIGESGGGKSTFLKVMRDLYHPTSLGLSVDGVPVTGFGAIADSISLIPQDPEIFTTTIRENITVGVDYPDTRIKVFTDMARFSSVVERLPHGLEPSIVEKGVNLSGGEKQRLALARGLLASADKDIILLDEPTSSVDFDNELGIYANIFESFPRATIVSAVHRLHLLQQFDSIYYFKAGKIVAQGSLEDIKAHPDFKDLWERYIAANASTDTVS